MYSLDHIIASNRAATKAAYVRALVAGNLNLAARIAVAYAEDYGVTLDASEGK